jgi:SET domain-containing protein
MQRKTNQQQRFEHDHMHIPEKQLTIKQSTISNAGKGLFTKTDIPAGSLIIEYKGRVTTWAEVKFNADNAYLYYVNSRYVIDGKPFLKSLARYANDAEGLTKVRGIVNNCIYEKVGAKVYIKAVKDIPAGSEILVSYGKEYWQTERKNRRLEELRKKKEGSLNPL